MDTILKWFEPLHIQSWYVLAAFMMAFVVQIAKKTPIASQIWNWFPSNWRWLWTSAAGFCTGFVSGYMLGLPAVGSVLSGIGGFFGVGLLSGGINDWLEKSKIPWPGSPPSSGGAKPPGG